MTTAASPRRPTPRRPPPGGAFPRPPVATDHDPHIVKYRACIHEHSCLRCPLLRPDPTARHRLIQIRDNLIARIAEAESHRWFGEAEGLKVSLAGARAKLAQMDQITARRGNSTVDLGIPSFTEAASRTVTTPVAPATREKPR